MQNCIKENIYIHTYKYLRLFLFIYFCPYLFPKALCVFHEIIKSNQIVLYSTSAKLFLFYVLLIVICRRFSIKVHCYLQTIQNLAGLLILTRFLIQIIFNDVT